MIRFIVRLTLPMVALVGMFVATSPAAHAYGTDHVYQLTFSLNCDAKGSPACLPPPDGFGLGGAWGWIEPDTDGADATLTFCSHSQGPSGAFHENLDGVAWTITSSANLGGAFAIGTDPNDQYIAFPNSDLAFVAFPATPGHYSVTFGAGIRASGTVKLMH